MFPHQLALFSITVSLWQYWTSAAFCGSDSPLFKSSTHFIPILGEPAGALKKPYCQALLLIEVLPHFYDRDLNNSVTPSTPVDFPLSWNFNLISPKFFLPIIRGTFLLIRFIIVSWMRPLFLFVPPDVDGEHVSEQSAEWEQRIRFVCFFLFVFFVPDWLRETSADLSNS